MNKSPVVLFLLFCALALLVLPGCKKSRGTDTFLSVIRGGQADGKDGKYNLSADTNRDGVVDTGGTDDYGENQWNAASGSAMLYNNDDDDSDSARDHANTSVDGAGDEPDLARLLVKQIADIGAGSYGTIEVDADSAGYVRMFKYNAPNWSVFTSGVSTISDAELAAGNVLLGIEARHYAETATGAAGLWTGRATLTLKVHNSGGSVVGTDKLTVRTAPFLLQTNIDSPQRLYICSTHASFVSDMTTLASSLGIPLTVISEADQWTQDQFEFGFVDMPVGGNPVVLNSPRNRGSFHDYAWLYLLDPDFGCLEYGVENMNSLNSFGNLECIPPHGSYPLGRVIVGGGGTRHMEASIREFLSAQSVQGPVLEIDTSWLAVGHVDEIMSFVPAPNARGWVIAYADVDTAIGILQSVPGGTAVFSGTGDATTAAGILNDSSLRDFNDEKQAQLGTIKNQLKAAIGLAETDFVKLPVLFRQYFVPEERAVAYTADAPNCIVLGSHVVVAKQYGPAPSGTDLFEQDITGKLGALGLTVHYVDDWATYHDALGEVHCGSNVLRTPPATPRWWESGR